MVSRGFHVPVVAVVIICSLLVTLAFSSAVWAQGPSGPALEKVLAALERHGNGLMGNPGVAGVAAGSKGISVFIENDADGAGIPKNAGGVPVIVKVTGKIVAVQAIDPKARFNRPVPIGVSVGNEGQISSGTIRPVSQLAKGLVSDAEAAYAAGEYREAARLGLGRQISL